MSKQWDELEDNRVTNEACWKAVDDNRLPNPPQDAVNEKDEQETIDDGSPLSVERQMVNKWWQEVKTKDTQKTKIIMAHEFREDPDAYKAVAQQVADAYNKEHILIVGGEEEK